jgi:hypothetical protein
MTKREALAEFYPLHFQRICEEITRQWPQCGLKWLELKHRAGNLLMSAFRWSVTPEGSQYWLRLSKAEELSDTRFRLEGNWSIGNGGTDHQQMIYEALEIAAHSDDKFKLAFAAMCEEWLELTKD